jgi:hypothetical protein
MTQSCKSMSLSIVLILLTAGLVAAITERATYQETTMPHYYETETA